MASAKGKRLSIDVEICGDLKEIVEDEIQADPRAASSRHRSAGKPARAGRQAGRRSAWRRVLSVVGAGGAGSATLAYCGHPVLLAAVAVAGVVALFGVAALGVLLWTSVYGDKVPREQAFRLMRFVADRGEPPAPELALIPVQAPRNGFLPSVREAGGRAQPRLRMCPSRRIAKSNRAGFAYPHDRGRRHTPHDL
jgi:hypothetical protein